MSLSVQVYSTDINFRAYEGRIREAAIYLLQAEGVESSEVTILLTDIATIVDLNHRFMEVDEETDVLSFPSGEANPESGKIYLGDVVLAVPIAEKQAAEKANQLIDELVLLTIHGTLHLLGYDHYGENEKQKMFAIQAKHLNDLGYDALGPIE